jgi:hypothetical protein
VVAAALGLNDEAARTCAEKLTKFDIVIAPGGDQAPAPRQLGNVTWIETGDRGRYLGTITFHPTVEESAWSYFDGGRSLDASLDARIERLRAEIEGLEEGEAKQARKVKLGELEQQRNAAKPSPPTTSYFTYDVEPIGRDLAPATWAKESLAEYNASLCDITKASTATRACEPAPTPADVYVGNEACRACHAAAFTVYDQMRHARAWATLQSAGKICDLGCIGCHTVGYEQPGGFCRVADAEQWKNVGCESCHGPGQGHVKSPTNRKAWSARFGKNSDPKTCTACHNPEHSDQFDFAAYLPKILGPGHGAAKTDDRAPKTENR